MFQPWRDWKQTQDQQHGFLITGHYASLYQGASDVLSADDHASSGVFRVNAKWSLLGQGTTTPGFLIATVDHRHAYSDLPPASLAGQAGYIGLTGTMFNDAGAVIVNLNWQQGLNDGNSGWLIGRYDPSDYMNVLGNSDPWSSFSNIAVLLDPSVAFADASWGIGAGHWVSDQFYLIGGINDANGLLTDSLEFFDGGAEFYSWAHLGWTPSKVDRYTQNIHMTLWHVDEREDADIGSSKGVALAASWSFDDTWVPYFRAGWSEGAAPIYNRSATIGITRNFPYRSDVAGLAINWGEPPDATLDSQTTVEAFWKIQFAQNLAITPSVQWLRNPSLNVERDEIWILGLRTRITF
ncbi:MAG: carbohydrate porin [bacterium]